MDTVSPSENSTQGHVIQLTTFADPTDCFQCGKRLQGRFFQGYRCLRCQASLHKVCLADCACLEVGAPLKKSNSLMLPTALPDSGLERSNSSLSLAHSLTSGDNGNGNGASTLGTGNPRADRERRRSQIREVVLEAQSNAMREEENTPLERQPWFAGDLPVKTANERLELLPTGTFLIRRRNNGQYALMLKCPEKPKGVKSMKIEEEVNPTTGVREYFLSQARKFPSLTRMIAHYRTRDLTENFNYEALQGVCLKKPFKDI